MNPLWPPFPGKAIKLFSSSSPKTLSLRQSIWCQGTEASSVSLPGFSFFMLFKNSSPYRWVVLIKDRVPFPLPLIHGTHGGGGHWVTRTQSRETSTLHSEKTACLHYKDSFTLIGLRNPLISPGISVRLEVALALHSSTLAWKIPRTEEPDRLQSMGLIRVGNDWATSLSFSLSCIGEGNGNPLQCSCLENPRDGGAWWAAVHGVAQSRTPLKWLSSSSSRGGLPSSGGHLPWETSREEWPASGPGRTGSDKSSETEMLFKSLVSRGQTPPFNGRTRGRR